MEVSAASRALKHVSLAWPPQVDAVVSSLEVAFLDLSAAAQSLRVECLAVGFDNFYLLFTLLQLLTLLILVLRNFCCRFGWAVLGRCTEHLEAHVHPTPTIA